MTQLRTITVRDGKYTMRQKDVDGMTIWDKPLRYGETWEAYKRYDSGPSSLECALADRILELEDQIKAIADAVVCDPVEEMTEGGKSAYEDGAAAFIAGASMPVNTYSEHEIVCFARGEQDAREAYRAVHGGDPASLKPGERRDVAFRFKDLAKGGEILHYAPNRHEALVWASANSINHFEDRYEFLGAAV